MLIRILISLLLIIPVFSFSQRSWDGGRDAVNRSDGNSNTVKHYDPRDWSPINTFSYCRLKQTDRNGTSYYSKIVPVNRPKALLDLISIYPNPAVHEFNIHMAGNKSDNVYVMIQDVLGREYYSNSIMLLNGESVISITPEMRLVSRIYTISSTAGNEMFKKN